MEHTTRWSLGNPANGDEYVGHVPLGQLKGTGTFRCAKNGAVYCGEYEGNRMHGMGVLTANGDSYCGQWNGGKMEGHGVQTLANGMVYRGQYKAGKMEGDGVFTWANGDVYRGKFKGGKREGVGVFIWTDGKTCRGLWKEDTCSLGMFTFADGRGTLRRWEGGDYVPVVAANPAVPFDVANPANAMLLRAANRVEVLARDVGAPDRHQGAIGRIHVRCRLKGTPLRLPLRSGAVGVSVAGPAPAHEMLAQEAAAAAKKAENAATAKHAEAQFASKRKAEATAAAAQVRGRAIHRHTVRSPRVLARCSSHDCPACTPRVPLILQILLCGDRLAHGAASHSSSRVRKRVMTVIVADAKASPVR
jgi:hypothetical protein